MDEHERFRSGQALNKSNIANVVRLSNVPRWFCHSPRFVLVASFEESIAALLSGHLDAPWVDNSLNKLCPMIQTHVQVG